MKELNFWWLILATSVCMIACTNEIPVLNDSESDLMQTNIQAEIPAIFNGDSNVSRTNVTTDFQITWNENDTIGIFPDEGDQIYFSMSGSANNLKTTFSGGGWALKSNNFYYAYYPFSQNNYVKKNAKNNVKMSMKGQIQTGDNSSLHLGDYDYMAAIGEVPSSGNIDFVFNHLVTFLRFDITLPIEGIIQKIVLKSAGNLYEEGICDFNVSPPVISPSDKVDELVLSCKELSVKSNQVFSVYMASVPMNLKGKNIIVSCVMDDDSSYSQELQITKEWKAGLYYVNTINAPVYESPTIKKVVLTSGGSLYSQIKNELYSIKRLTIDGPLDDNDINYIRIMAGRDNHGKETSGKLKVLDLSNAQIVDDNRTFGSFYYADDWMHLYYETTENSIGDYMFYQTNLESVILPKSITHIGESAFKDCELLEEIVIPEGVTQIGEYAFAYCDLKSVVLPQSITSIGSSAFYNNSNLEQINIPKGVMKIESGTFSGCNLSEIELPEDLEEIGSYAFESNPLTSVVIPNKVKSIGDFAFRNAYNNSLWDGNLTNIVIGKSVQHIGNEAFQNDKLSFYFDSFLIYNPGVVYTVTSYARDVPGLMSGGGGVFPYSASKKGKLYVPKGCKINYELKGDNDNNDFRWGDYFTNIIEMEE